ncbi:MAG: TetR family transcriptional regulator [Actinobacteria bacterium]|nr:TetR family transcriptional regulator [Actinomycetota bacterium]
MAAQEIVENTPDARPSLRNEPVQARSAARLSALLDAAAQIVDEIGYERLTTAMVAERAGASIGTVYRYFPDRIAVLQALAARNLERVLEKTTNEILDPKNETWASALKAASAVLIDAHRTEAGFSGLRFGDVLDLRPASLDRTFNSIVSDRIVDALVERFGFTDSPEFRFRFETAVEISDALATRAFARDPQGDEAFLQVSREVVTQLLAQDLGTP